MLRDPKPAPSGVFRAIWKTVTRIPRGRVATYGQIARMSGMPGGARTVGWAMHAVPPGARVGGRPVPWHRVINARGTISPRPATGAGEGPAGQERRLRKEGVVFGPGGRIDLARHLWRGNPPRRRA